MTRTPRDLTDPAFLTWGECVERFGDPLSSQSEAVHEKGNAQTGIIQKGKSRTKIAMVTFDQPDIITMLSQPKFNALDFIKNSAFANDISRNHLQTHISQSGDLIDDFNKSPIQKIADELHHYVAAVEDLQQSNTLFMQGQFPGQVELQDLAKKIEAIANNTSEFFGAILDQNKKAYEASKELNRIGANGFLFTLATDIEKMRSLGQFDEIIRVYEKKKKLPYLEKQMPFSIALQNVEKALRGVEDSLRSKILQMTPKTFNEKYCTLLMGIQPSKNPILEIIRELDQRVRDSFSYQSMVEGCTMFENTFPFFKTLTDCYKDNYPEKYIEFMKNVELTILPLINFINIRNKESLEKLAKSQKKLEFNPDLHKDVTRLSQMWKVCAKTKFMDKAIYKNHEELKNWYYSFLQKLFPSLLSSYESSSNIVSFLLQSLEGGDLFTPEKYLSLITNPIFALLDQIHEKIMKNDCNLVQFIKMLLEFSKIYFNQIFRKYEQCVRQTFDEQQKHNLILVTNELTELLKHRLLHSVSIELNTKIYQSIFMSCIDWSSTKLPICIDGWLVYLLNKVIECKCEWGDLYYDLREDIISLITSSFLYSIKQLPSISPAAKQRFILNLAILEDTFWMEPLIPIPDPSDPSNQRTLEPPFGALGKKPELAYDAIENELGMKQNDLVKMRKTSEYNNARQQLAMQIKSLTNIS